MVGYFKSWALSLFLFFSGVAFAGPEDSFYAPTFSDYLSLSEEAHQVIREKYPQMLQSDFAEKWVGNAYPSFYRTEDGREELARLASTLIVLSGKHSRVVMVGRSPNGLLAMMLGYHAAHPELATRIQDLPFSTGSGVAPSAEESAQLRSYLARNGLHPETIAAASEPILFVDYLYSGKGVLILLNEIQAWSRELEVEHLVKENLSFYGIYSGNFIMRHEMMTLHHECMKEMGMLGSRIAPPTEAEILKAGVLYEMPRKYQFEQVAGRVYHSNISEEMFEYARNIAPTIQASYRRALWSEVQPVRYSGFPTTKERAAIEFHYLLEEGLRFNPSACVLGLMGGLVTPMPSWKRPLY